MEYSLMAKGQPMDHEDEELQHADDGDGSESADDEEETKCLDTFGWADWMGPKETIQLEVDENIFDLFVLFVYIRHWRKTPETKWGNCGWNWSGLFLKFCLVLITLYFQWVFAVHLVPAVIQNDFQPKIDLQVYESWRLDPKRGSQTLDRQDALGKSFAELACTGRAFSFAEEKADDLGDYVAPASLFNIPGTTIGFPMSAGKLFGILAIALWGGTVSNALRGWCRNATLVAKFFYIHVESSKRSNVYWHPRVLVLIVIFVFRLIIIANLAYWGVKFLAWTDNLKDFILNSVALGFIFDLPTLVYTGFASSHDKNLFAEFGERQDKNEANFPALEYDVPVFIARTNGLGFLMFALAITAWGGFHWLRPFATALEHGVYGKMCAANPANASGGVF